MEYKRGKPKSHDADRVQLCAQSLCLEEMLGTTLDEGFLFYGKQKRRTVVKLDEALRQLTMDTTTALHRLIESRITHHAAYEARKCDSCSLLDRCQPHSLQLERGAASWRESALTSDHQTAVTGESAA